MRRLYLLAAMAIAFVGAPASAAGLVDGMKKGTPQPKSVGAMAFGPEGVLFVADAKGMEIFAIATGDTAKAGSGALAVPGIDGKIADMLGTKADNVSIKDMKANPASGNVYLSVMKGTSPLILKVDGSGKISEMPMKDVPFSSVQLKKVKEGDKRSESITGIVFDKDRLFVAALPNEEFASNLRSYQFPFEKGDDGIRTEIFHAAHNKTETASPVQTLMAMDIAGKTHILAAYTCTPLVKFPVDDLKGGKSLRGTTVAELGNMNKPLDMISYKAKDGKEYVLMANTRHGILKVSTEGIDQKEGLTTAVKGGGRAGLTCTPIETLKDVVQLDKLDATHAVILSGKPGALELKAIDLP